MIRASVVFIVLFAIQMATVMEAGAGAWTQKKGGYYLKLAGGYLNSTEDIDATGSRIQKAGLGELRDVNYSLYLEYGVLNRLTLVASVPYKRLRDTRTFATGKAFEKRSGFGDLEMRLRWQAYQKSFVASLALGGKLPMWYDEDPNTRVPLSSTEIDVDGRLLLGKSLYPFPGYLTGEFGYRKRGGNFSNELFYGLEAGVNVDRFLFKGFVSGIHTSGMCATTAEVGLIGDQNVLKFSPGIIYNVNSKLEMSLDFIHVASGCNTGAGNTILFGFAFKK